MLGYSIHDIEGKISIYLVPNISNLLIGFK